MQEIRRILFIRTDRMGDVLMNLPAIRLLRQAYPKSWMTVLVDAPAEDLLRHHPDIDEVMAIPAKKIKESFFYRLELARLLRKGKFDLAVVSNPDKGLHQAVFLAGIPRRVGYRRKWGFLLTRSAADRKAVSGRHEIDSNLELMKLLTDKTWDGRLLLSPDESAKISVEGLLAKSFPDSRQILAVHPGTSNPAKRWAADNFARLCELLRNEKNLALALVGGAEERQVSKEIRAKTNARVVDLTGGLSLSELTAFLGHERVRLLVSSDSGPVHIAWISGTPVVAMYAKDVSGSDPARWGPRDGKSEIIHKPMAEISVPDVFEAVKRILQRVSLRAKRSNLC